MRRSPVGRLVPLVFALSLRVAAAQQATPPDPVESATVRLGPIGFNPALLIRDVGRETNVFNEAIDPKSDFTATISPRLEIVMHPGPMRFSYTTTSDYVYYQTYKSEGGTNVGSAVRAEFDLGPFTPFASAGFANTRDRLNREIDARARHHDESYAAGTHVQLFDNFFVNAGARRSSTAFDSGADFRGQELQTTLNRTDEALDAGGGLALTPLTSLQVTVSRERSRFEFTPERNSESLRVMPSVTFSPLAILSGTASFGYRRFDGASAQVPDYRGFVSNVTLSTTVKERQHIDATFTRDLQYLVRRRRRRIHRDGADGRLELAGGWAGRRALVGRPFAPALPLAQPDGQQHRRHRAQLWIQRWLEPEESPARGPQRRLARPQLRALGGPNLR